MLLRLPMLVVPALVVALADPARAGCCTLRKLDSTNPTVTVRACEAASAGGCGAQLFLGPLSVGDSREICSAEATIVYQEAPPGEPLGGFVEAVCAGDDVEI